ncbi:MAG: thiolase family protein [Syntrophorhabdaceae bacterium]|nr:thiolase family protein [Syntrophorhabdaceae bacterium]HOC46583.1 thiolase family protein [Syntrophorhabdaceae bacterium]
MRKVDIIGVGMTSFGKHVDKTFVELGAMAILEAMRDADIKPSQIGAGFSACVLAGRLFGAVTSGQTIFWEAGINCIPIVNVENACTSGSTAINLAWTGIAAGMYDTAIVVGVEKMIVSQLGLISSGDTELDTLEGLVTPASFAMRAVRHMKTYGTTPGQLALVAVKNRLHASLNSLAQFKDPISVEDVLNAPMIADPLTRLSCCPNADGAAAVILCTAGKSRHFKSRPVRLAASVLVTGSYENPLDLVPWETDARACQEAYDLAGIGPSDIDVAECHDAFTISEILHYEAMQLCPEGEGGRLIESGATCLGGRIPVNTSGGLLSKGHPVAATGVAQIVEGVRQLRGQANGRQVEGAKAFFAQCMGGDKDGDARSCTANILTV